MYLIHKIVAVGSLGHEELSNQWPHLKLCAWPPALHAGPNRGAGDEPPW